MIYFISLFFAINTLLALKNEGKDCWLECNRRSGACGFCGEDGACCRKGHDSERYPECGGRGSIYAHVCIKQQDTDKAAKIDEGCKKCVNVDGWPCFSPQDDLKDEDDLPENALPCFAADHETGKCAKGLVDCRTHIDDTDFSPDTCTGERIEQYKLIGVQPESSEIKAAVNRDSTPWGVRDWDRFLFSTFIEGKKAPTSLRLVIRWRDQGWGNRKGAIRICYKGRIHQIVPVMASHKMMTYTVEVGDGVFFEWAENALGKDNFNEGQLHFSYVVGGGSGHTLTIVDMKVNFGFDTLPQHFTYGECEEKDRYFPVVLGRSCQQFCWKINKQCKKAEKEPRYGKEYCLAEKYPKGDFDCESSGEARLICTCEKSDEPVPTPRPTLEPGHKDVYTRVWPFGSLLGQMGVQNAYKSDLIKVTAQSTAHIIVEAKGPVEHLDIYGDKLRTQPQYNYEEDFSLKVVVSGKDVTPKTVVEVYGMEWMGDYEYHFEKDDEVQFLIYSQVLMSSDLYSVDLRVDHAMKLKDVGGGDKKDKDGCGYLAKKISWENQEIVKKASSNKKVKLTACDCRDLCESAPSKAWSFLIKRAKCMCYGPKENGKPLVIKKISGNGKKASMDTAKVIVSHQKKGEL